MEGLTVPHNNVVFDVAAIKHLSPAAIGAKIIEMRTGDAVELLNELDSNRLIKVIKSLPAPEIIRLLDQPELHEAPKIIAALPNDQAAELLEDMFADRATDIFQRLNAVDKARLLSALKPETSQTLRNLIRYKPNTAGSLMTTEFISVPSDWSVAETIEHVRQVERTRETVYAIYIVDVTTNVLLGVVSLRRLITQSPDEPILSISRDVQPLAISPLEDRENVARLFRKHDLLAVPVVDDQHKIIGIVTVDDVLDAITDEATEDAYRFGGMEALDKPYMRIGFMEMLKKRGGWLGILFIGEMLTASAMQHFEMELEKAIVLTLFIPLIMSSGGNSGSQATSLIIRSLALQELKLKDWWRVAIREIPTGLALGSFLGLIGALRISMWQSLGIYDYGEHWDLVAITVAIALVCIVAFGTVTGSMLPFILKRLNFDPATASAPFVATLVDVSGLVIYFSVALLILSGTLL